MGKHKEKWPLVELSSKAVLKRKHLLYKLRFISVSYLVLSKLDWRYSIVIWHFKSNRTDSRVIYKKRFKKRPTKNGKISDSPICWAVYGIRGKGRGELISNVKLMTGWEQGSESLILNIQTTDGSDRLTSTSDQGRSWEIDHSS